MHQQTLTISATPERSTLVMIQALTHTHLVSIKPLQVWFPSMLLFWKWQCSFWMPEDIAWSWRGFLQHMRPAAMPQGTRGALTLSPGACWCRHESQSHRSRSAVCLTWSRGWTSVRCREINTASAKVINHTLLYNVISLCTTLLNCFKGLFSPKLKFSHCLFTINISYATCELYTTVEKFGPSFV